MEQTFQLRQIAYIVQIKDILDSNFVKEDGLNPNYVKIGMKKVSRVNMIGVVIENDEKDNLQDIVIDDGTGKISCRNFERKIDVKIGEVIHLVGRIREYGSTKYLTPEIIKRNINSKWSIIWKRISLKNNKNDNKIDEINENSEEESLSVSDDLLSKIRDLDSGDGALYREVIKSSADEKEISQLLLRGDVFEIKPGRLKVLD